MRVHIQYVVCGYVSLPIMVGGCQDNGGAGVSIAGDPRAVDGKEHHEHHHEQDYHSTQVAVGKVAGSDGWVNILLLLSSFGVLVLCVCVCVQCHVYHVSYMHITIMNIL